MAISRKAIEELTFSSRKGKYYVGEEVDAALDLIAREVELLQNELLQVRSENTQQNSQRMQADQIAKESLVAVLNQLTHEIIAAKEELEEAKSELRQVQSQTRKIRHAMMQEMEKSIALHKEWMEALQNGTEVKDLPSDTEDTEIFSPALSGEDAQRIADMDIWN